MSININRHEKPEQDLAREYIKETDRVLELGARYGSVSCVINSKLKDKKAQVVVEPDDRVWEALDRNRAANKCEFHIVKGFISAKKRGLINVFANNGYGATSIETHMTKIPSFTLKDVREKYGVDFNVLVADCEGFLEVFFDENPDFYDTLRLIIFEADYPDKCNYDKIKQQLKERGFEKMLEGHQNVWINASAAVSSLKNSPHS
jgi:FkbM family methyltransferase